MREHMKGKENELILPQMVIEMLYELTKGEAILTTGVGQHQMWAAQFYKFKYPRQLLTSAGLGAMGYGLPAALGAKVAFPDRQVSTSMGRLVLDERAGIGHRAHRKDRRQGIIS
jgi:acetolactate synthase-1/2/3 large subunit